MKCLHPGVVAWIPDFFFTSVRILSVTGFLSADSTDFHQDEKMEPRLWCCVLKLNLTPCRSQCTNCGAPRPACSVFSDLANCWTMSVRKAPDSSETPGRRLRSVNLIGPFGLWAPQFRGSLPAVEVECYRKLSPSALTLKKTEDLQEMIQTLFLPTSFMTTHCEKPVIPEWSSLTLLPLSSSVQYLDIKIPRTTISACDWDPPHKSSSV